MLEKLKAMGYTIDKVMASVILIASIVVVQLQQVTATIKILAEDKVNWYSVSDRIIE